MRIAAAGTNRRISVFGALDPTTGTVTSMLADRADTEEFLRFLSRMLDQVSNGPLLLVMDNAAYHKSGAARRWLSAHRDRITVLFLPTYSPHLNPIERVWRMLKHHLACHAFWNDREGLRQHTQTLLDQTVARIGQGTSPAITMGQNFWQSA